MAKYAQWMYAWYETLKARDDEGQGLVEYGLIIVLVGLAVVVALTAVGTQLNTVFGDIKTKLTSAT